MEYTLHKAGFYTIYTAELLESGELESLQNTSHIAHIDYKASFSRCITREYSHIAHSVGYACIVLYHCTKQIKSIFVWFRWFDSSWILLATPLQTTQQISWNSTIAINSINCIHSSNSEKERRGERERERVSVRCVHFYCSFIRNAYLSIYAIAHWLIRNKFSFNFIFLYSLVIVLFFLVLFAVIVCCCLKILR